MELIDNLGEVASNSEIINAEVRVGHLNVLHFNAQSLVPRENRTKFDEIKSMMENSLVDAFGISETWYNELVSDSAVRISGFKVYRCDRIYSKGGGVCLYIREHLKARVIYNSNDDERNDDDQHGGNNNNDGSNNDHGNDNNNVSVSSGNNASGNNNNSNNRNNNDDRKVEALFVEVVIDNSMTVLLGVVYLPQGDFPRCGDLLTDLSSRYENVLIMGDFNTNIFVQGDLVREFCSHSALSVVHNSRPTHFCNRYRSTSLIDYFFVSDIELVMNTNQFQIPALNSYHSVIQISYHLPVPENSSEFFYRDYNRLDVGQCYLELQSVDFSSFYDNPSVDEKAALFNSVVQRLFNSTVPLRRVLAHNIHNWMNDTRVCRARHIRNQAYRAYRENGTDENFRMYCVSRNKLKSVIRRVRREKCLKFFSSCDQKQLWRKLRTIGVVNGNESQFSLDMDEFNEYSRMPNILLGESNFDVTSLNRINGFSFSNVSEDDVFFAMSQIKSDAIGADGIHLKFLKLIFPAISVHLTFLINSVITSSFVPAIWKVGKIIPIPKVKFPRSTSDYRPISILSVCSKILEVILRQQMLSYLNTSAQISDFQSGFRRGHSTAGVLLDITETIRMNLDVGNINALIFLDFCKAFDSVSHGVLVRKLYERFEFSSCGCKLIWSLLTNRSQFVQVGDSYSQSLQVYRGVPQGSILGPLLFLLYINDIFQNLSFLRCYTYADDIQLLATTDIINLQSFQSRINSELECIVEWSRSNFLELNPLKCKVMLFAKDPGISLNIILDNQPLEFVSQYKTLGVILDCNLTFDYHINFIISRISWTLRSLYNVAYYLPLGVRRKVALSLCLPIFLYCMEVYSCTSQGNIDRLRVCFNRVVRYIYRLRISDHVSGYYRELLGCDFGQYINLRRMIFFYKIVKYGNPSYLLQKFHFGTSSRTRTLIPPRNSSLLMSRSFCVITASLWNQKIPYRDRTFSHSLSTFKNILLLHL